MSRWPGNGDGDDRQCDRCDIRASPGYVHLATVLVMNDIAIVILSFLIKRSERRAALLLLGLVFALAGCATPSPPSENDPARGRIIAERMRSERDAALLAPGTRVCREMKFGIAESDWITARVLAATVPGQWRVEIIDQGRMTHSLNGAPIRKNTVVEGTPEFWIPGR